MRVLAVDPGTRRLGWALLEGDRFAATLLKFGVYRPAGEGAKRLEGICRKIESLVRLHRPKEVVVERAYLGRNVMSLERLAEARAAVMIGAARARRPVRQYAASEAKQAAARFGGASKEQVQRSVRESFGLGTLPAPDAADAIALGMCHLMRLS